MKEDLEALRNEAKFDHLISNDPVISFGLGDLTYHLHMSDDRCKLQLEQWYKGFYTQESRNPIRIGYLGENELDPELYSRLIEESKLYRNIQVITSHPLLSEDEMAVFRWDFRAIINRKSRTGRVFLLNPVSGSIDAIARVAGALLYADYGAFLVHGSSIEHNGKGYLFTGVSGSGKSTIAELSGARVLNDEISMVMLESDGKVYVHGTPFYGDLKKGENIKVPLAGIFLLKQDQKSFIKDLDPVKQQLFLLRNVVFFQTDQDSFDQIQSLVERTLESKPLQTLHFKNDKSFMEVLP